MLALECARAIALAGKDYTLGCVFVEKEPAHARALEALAKDYPAVDVSVIAGDFWAVTEQVAGIVRGDPYLLMIDPYGIKDLDLAKLAKLAKASSRCDLVVTFVESAVPRLETQYKEAIAQAIGERDPSERSAAETFSRNMAVAGRFLPGGRYAIKQNFDAAKSYELIVFSRSAHAYELWNDFMTKETAKLKQGKWLRTNAVTSRLPEFEEAFGEAEAVDEPQEASVQIMDWARASSGLRFTREQMIHHFVVNCFTCHHTSTWKTALSHLEGSGEVRRLHVGKPIDKDKWEITR